MHKDRADILAALLSSSSETGPPPTSAIRDLRGSKRQEELATEAGISQAHLSDLETGRRELTRDVALKLAMPLGVKASDLELAETLATMQRAALKGEMNPERLLDAILKMADAMPDSNARDEVVDMLVEVLKKSLETYQQARTEGSDATLSLKSRQDAEPGNRPVRDGTGRNLNKAYDPRRWNR